MVDVALLEKNIGVSFIKKELLLEALTHRSYLNENPKWGVSHNERLEFLGDAVLELVITEDLFLKYKDHDEGKLTSLRSALVNYQILARVAQGLQVGKFIFLSAGEAKDTGRAREVILANTLEAIVGAIHLDRGYGIAKKFIDAYVFTHIDEVIQAGLYKDPKSYLQEVIQERMRVTPTYRVLDERGPDHRRVFKIGVFFGDKFIAEGEGLSKQDGEIRAAEHALKELNIEE